MRLFLFAVIVIAGLTSCESRRQYILLPSAPDSIMVPSPPDTVLVPIPCPPRHRRHR